ncbi:hypothetical protein [Inconstantimicrobium mannanitabidum]|uniref:Uncharacterized protein n=1 Tax=Inconstantimicrobium mannanitabidum TaxID=1604901 RepID=A0ACB5RBR5_9CLOT|nr:hypothetical protein [Clostridium sp. TW13]GKX66463.1 hypothetical protein rsdtw13_17210 [Clostridium sp. TW13]
MKVNFEKATLEDVDELISVRNKIYKKAGYTIVNEFMNGTVKLLVFEKKIS